MRISSKWCIILPYLKMKVFSGRSRREFNLVSAGASHRSDLSLSTRKRSRECEHLESSDESNEESESKRYSLAELTRQQNPHRVKPNLTRRPPIQQQNQNHDHNHNHNQKQKQKQKAVKRTQYEYVSLADTVHHMHKLVNVYAVRIVQRV